VGDSWYHLGIPGLAEREGKLRRVFLFSGGVIILIVLITTGLFYFFFSSPVKDIVLTYWNSVFTYIPAASSNCDDVPLQLNRNQVNEFNQPFYGVQFVPTEDLPVVADMGVEVVSQVFPYKGSPESWLYQLDQAQEHNIKVIATLYPQGWEWEETNWRIDDQAHAFIRTVADHPALFAVYALHEPYWQGCRGCGYTTNQQQLLYNEIKEIADVPVFSDIDSISFWTNQGEETAFAEGVCDYCATWYYPFTSDAYERDQLINWLKAEVAVALERAPNSKIVWYMQSFAQDPLGLRMPQAEEMYDLASLVYESGMDGAIWYVWTFESLYDDYLSNHPELHDTVRQIYQDLVLPCRIAKQEGCFQRECIGD
jgi:hypothetical protein